MAERKRPKRPSIPNTFNDAARTAFRLALVETGSIRGAAARAGVDQKTIYYHAGKEPDFRKQIEDARGEFEQSILTGILKAGVQGDVIERRGKKITKPGDWRALAWLLEHHPAYRDHYAGILRQRVELGGSPELPPIETHNTETQQIEIGPDTMERLTAVVQILLSAGKLRLPEPGEVIIDGDAEPA